MHTGHLRQAARGWNPDSRARHCPLASRFHLNGQLALRYGVGEVINERAGVALKSEGKITAGPVLLTIEPGQGNYMYPVTADGKRVDQPVSGSERFVTLGSTEPLSLIKKIMFPNATGKEIPQQSVGSADMTVDATTSRVTARSA
jgi:hypothetical protein